MADPWAILADARSRAPNLADAYMGGRQQRIQEMMLDRQMKRADVEAQRADAEWTRKQKEYDREDKVREGLTAAYDPVTGRLDTGKARAAYLGAGDIGGAMEIDKNEATRRKAQLEGAWSEMEATARLLGGVKDAQSFAQARAQAQAMGLDMRNVPAEYDPAWVQRTQAQALDLKDRISMELDRERFEETRRHNRATEGTAAGALGLAQQRERRIAAGGPGGDITTSSTDQLLGAAGLK